MELIRQIEYDKKNLSEINTAICETQDRFNEAIKTISKLNTRLNELSEMKKDFQIRISIREQQLKDERV